MLQMNIRTDAPGKTKSSVYSTVVSPAVSSSRCLEMSKKADASPLYSPSLQQSALHVLAKPEMMSLCLKTFDEVFSSWCCGFAGGITEPT